MEREIKITEGKNGFVLTYLETLEDGIVAPATEVIECDGLERDTLKYLLVRVAEFFDTFETRYNKFGNENLSVSWDKPGSKL
jgi:hypothetical protein